MSFSIFCLDVLFSHNKRCYLSRVVVELSELDTAITDAFHNNTQEMRDDEKTICLGKKWKMAFNSSSKIHLSLIHISEPTRPY